MENCWPALPVNEGVQSNCWKLVLILGYLQYLINIITIFANETYGSIVNEIINIIFFTMFQYHSLYYTIEITEEMVEIKGGPCQWCQSCNSKEQITRWCSASWCFSSQIYKTEIVSIETRTAHFWPDWCPRFYCNPIMWCCCHKSYSGWYFPFCCSNCNCLGLCDGDVGPVTDLRYVQFNLSESPTACLFPNRCTPNIWSACTYNRISYVLRDPSVVDQLKQCGYTVLEPVGGAPAQGQTVTTTTTTTTTTTQPAGTAVVVQQPAPAQTEGGGAPPTTA